MKKIMVPVAAAAFVGAIAITGFLAKSESPDLNMGSIRWYWAVCEEGTPEEYRVALGDCLPTEARRYEMRIGLNDGGIIDVMGVPPYGTPWLGDCWPDTDSSRRKICDEEWANSAPH